MKPHTVTLTIIVDLPEDADLQTAADDVADEVADLLRHAEILASVTPTYVDEDPV